MPNNLTGERTVLSDLADLTQAKLPLSARSGGSTSVEIVLNISDKPKDRKNL